MHIAKNIKKVISNYQHTNTDRILIKFNIKLKFKTKVLIHQAQVTLEDFRYSV
jgi:hypothetical protein